MMRSLRRFIWRHNLNPFHYVDHRVRRWERFMNGEDLPGVELREFGPVTPPQGGSEHWPDWMDDDWGDDDLDLANLPSGPLYYQDVDMRERIELVRRVNPALADELEASYRQRRRYTPPKKGRK